MPRELSLGGMPTKSGPAPVNRDSILFAVHAVAILNVHDSPEAQEKNLTLRAICAEDDYMRERVDDLTCRLFRTFGRQCLPVFGDFLEEGTTSGTEPDIAGITSTIRSRLNL